MMFYDTSTRGFYKESLWKAESCFWKEFLKTLYKVRGVQHQIACNCMKQQVFTL